MGRRQILSLKDSDGTIVSDSVLLKILASKFFKLLYTDDVDFIPFTSNHVFSTLFSVNLTHLCVILTEEEIKKALFSVNGLKTPGPNGFIALFYQNQWQV